MAAKAVKQAVETTTQPELLTSEAIAFDLEEQIADELLNNIDWAKAAILIMTFDLPKPSNFERRHRLFKDRYCGYSQQLPPDQNKIFIMRIAGAKVRSALLKKAPAKLFAWLVSGNDTPVTLSPYPELAALPSADDEEKAA